MRSAQRESTAPAASAPSGGAPAPPRPRRGWRAGGAVLALLLAAAALGPLWSYWRLNAWLDEGGRRLAPLEVVLIDAGRRADPAIATTGPMGDDEPAPTLDAMILRTQTRDRHVRHLSRSAPYRAAFLRTGYVKVFMETELVGDAGTTRPISFVIRYRAGRDGFRMLGTDTLGI